MTAKPIRPRVLIVEDFVIIQESIRLVLERACDVVATAQDSETALAAAAELRPDLVTIDVSLPGASGFVLAEMLRDTLPSAQTIFVSAHAEQSYVDAAFAAGARGYVLKGSMQAELPAAIREVTAGRLYLSPRLQAKRRAGPAT